MGGGGGGQNRFAPSDFNCIFQVENSIVHMTPDGSARVTLARRVATSGDTPPGMSKFSSTDSVPQGTAKRISADRRMEEKESVEEEEELEEVGQWVRIEDSEQVPLEDAFLDMARR